MTEPGGILRTSSVPVSRELYISKPASAQSPLLQRANSVGSLDSPVAAAAKEPRSRAHPLNHTLSSRQRSEVIAVRASGSSSTSKVSSQVLDAALATHQWTISDADKSQSHRAPWKFNWNSFKVGGLTRTFMRDEQSAKTKKAPAESRTGSGEGQQQQDHPQVIGQIPLKKARSQPLMKRSSGASSKTTTERRVWVSGEFSTPGSRHSKLSESDSCADDARTSDTADDLTSSKTSHERSSRGSSAKIERHRSDMTPTVRSEEPPPQAAAIRHKSDDVGQRIAHTSRGKAGAALSPPKNPSIRWLKGSRERRHEKLHRRSEPDVRVMKHSQAPAARARFYSEENTNSSNDSSERFMFRDDGAIPARTRLKNWGSSAGSRPLSQENRSSSKEGRPLSLNHSSSKESLSSPGSRYDCEPPSRPPPLPPTTQKGAQNPSQRTSKAGSSDDAAGFLQALVRRQKDVGARLSFEQMHLMIGLSSCARYT